jgi:hypothetical protein
MGGNKPGSMNGRVRDYPTLKRKYEGGRGYGEAAGIVRQVQIRVIHRREADGRRERNPAGHRGKKDCPATGRQSNRASIGQVVQVRGYILGGSWGEFCQVVPENYLNIPNL